MFRAARTAAQSFLRKAGAEAALQRSGAEVRRVAAKWGGAVTVGGLAYFLAVDPVARDEWWARHVRAKWTQPLAEWREAAVHGERKKQLFAHFGLIPRGGDVLELFPGSGGATFPCLEALASPDNDPRVVRRPLQWRGLDVDSAAWEAGEIAAEAAQHTATAKSMLSFDSCAAHKRSYIELMRALPDNSVQYVLAMHGLSPLFSAPAHSSAALSARTAPSSAAGDETEARPPPPTPDAELAVVLREVTRVLKPGGCFIFVEEAQSRNRSEGVKHTWQRLSYAVRSRLPGGALARAPTELLQHLPSAGFATVHVEQWPAWADPSNPRRGIRLLRFAAPGAATAGSGTDAMATDAHDDDDELYTSVEGLRGLRPLVAGVATKAALQRAAPMNVFTQPPKSS
jgi:SAM-dependent methyltransferase